MSKTNVPRLIQSWNRFILHQIHLQCTEKCDKADKEDSPPHPAADWSRSSPSKRTGESEDRVTSEELANISSDMADVLDRSAGAGEKTLQEVRTGLARGDMTSKTFISRGKTVLWWETCWG